MWFPYTSIWPTYLIRFRCRCSTGCYLFLSRHPWAVSTAFTQLSSLPPTTYLFITNALRRLLSSQMPDLKKKKRGDKGNLLANFCYFKLHLHHILEANVLLLFNNIILCRCCIRATLLQIYLFFSLSGKTVKYEEA